MKRKIIIITLILIVLLFVVLGLLLVFPSLFGHISAKITDICRDEDTTKDFAERSPSYVITDVEDTLFCDKTDREYFLENIDDYVAYVIEFDVKNDSPYYIVYDYAELEHDYGASVILSMSPMEFHNYCEPHTDYSGFGSIGIYIDASTYSQTEIEKLLSEIEINFCYEIFLSENSIFMSPSSIGKNRILLEH